MFTRLVRIPIQGHPVSVVGVFGSKFLWVSDPLGQTVALLVLLENDGISKCFRRNQTKLHCYLVLMLLEIAILRTGTVQGGKGTGF